MKFFCPQGIGDSLWALHKIRAVARAHGADRINLFLASNGTDEVQRRALPFLERFTFLESAGLVEHHCLRREGRPLTPEGYWDYLPDGWLPELGAYALMPNAALERGKRLEDWLPGYEIDWNTMAEFRFTPEEEKLADDLRWAAGRYAVFYCGPLTGNTTEGHNRGGLWRPEDWLELGAAVRALGMQIVVVGAPYDAGYYRGLVAPRATGWHDRIGQWHIGQTLAVVRRADLCVSYQSGIGICAHYQGVPTAMWWRPKGDSAAAHAFISFEEAMSHCWTNPAFGDRYLPLIYGRCSAGDIMAFVEGLP